MKQVYPLFLFFLLISCGETPSEVNHSSATKTETPDLNWLLGNWKRTNDKEGRETFEYWTKKSNQEYIGLGFTLQELDTVFKENMRIVEMDGTLVFEVTGVNESPTLFHFSNQTTKSFVCKNEQNEFPKKIAYEEKGEILEANISGGEMEISFLFEKIKLD